MWRLGTVAVLLGAASATAQLPGQEQVTRQYWARLDAYERERDAASS